MKTIKVNSELEQVNTIIAFLEKELEGADCPLKTVTLFSIAVDELFSNIVLYSGSPYAEIVLDIQDAEIYLTFIDNGKPYNPLEKEDPDITLSAEERKIGGLGIYMVKKSMDDMKYEYKGGENHLTLIKKR